MKVKATALPEVLLIELERHEDDRGRFVELWRHSTYIEAGVPGPFVQDNLSYSKHGVLRGLHYQWPNAQGKLVSVVRGEVFDVAVDVRQGSPTFGRWVGEYLSEDSCNQMWIPAGFAHGFLVLSDEAYFQYKVTRPYLPDEEVTLRWDEPAFGIEWPLADPVVGPRDASAPPLAEVPTSRIPVYRPPT